MLEGDQMRSTDRYTAAAAAKPISDRVASAHAARFRSDAVLRRWGRAPEVAHTLSDLASWGGSSPTTINRVTRSLKAAGMAVLGAEGRWILTTAGRETAAALAREPATPAQLPRGMRGPEPSRHAALPLTETQVDILRRLLRGERLICVEMFGPRFGWADAPADQRIGWAAIRGLTRPRGTRRVVVLLAPLVVGEPVTLTARGREAALAAGVTP